MNPPPDHPDSLLKCLVEEAMDLPTAAAREAQLACARRDRRRRQFAVVLVMAVAAVCAWQALPSRQPARKEIAQLPAPITSSLLTPPAVPAQYVKVQTEQEAMTDPLPIPAGLSKEQHDLLEASRGLPLLLVKDASGKVTSIHVIER